MSAYKVVDKLEAAIDKFKERNAQYGDAFADVASIFEVMFPDGVTLATRKEQLRYQVLSWIVGKLLRYTAQFNKGGHQDSIHDLIVYAAMLEAIDDHI